MNIEDQLILALLEEKERCSNAAVMTVLYIRSLIYSLLRHKCGLNPHEASTEMQLVEVMQSSRTSGEGPRWFLHLDLIRDLGIQWRPGVAAASA